MLLLFRTIIMSVNGLKAKWTVWFSMSALSGIAVRLACCRFSGHHP